MPVGAAIGVAGVAGAGASVYGANKASSAASKAANQNAQIEQQQYQTTRGDLAPYTNAGYTATAALMQRLGLTPAAGAAPAAAATPQPATIPAVPDTGAGTGSVFTASAPAAASGAVDYAQVLRDRPDVAAEYQRVAAVADPNSPRYQQLGLDRGPEGFAQYWYENMRNPADYSYQAPAAAPSVAATAPQTIPGATLPATSYTDPGPRNFTTAAPTFGPAPSVSSYVDPSKFETSPGFQFRQDQALRDLNAKYGGRGLLKSGAAMQGITDYVQGQAASEYGNWFNQQMQKYGADASQYNQDRAVGLAQFNQDRNVFNQNYDTDRAFGRGVFEGDRGYNTGLYNNYTDNLFRIAGSGQSAAADVANAGQNYASNMTANNNALASVQGNAAIAGANGINSALNTASMAYGMRSNPFSVSAGQTFNPSTAYKFSPF